MTRLVLTDSLTPISSVLSAISRATPPSWAPWAMGGQDMDRFGSKASTNNTDVFFRNLDTPSRAGTEFVCVCCC